MIAIIHKLRFFVTLLIGIFFLFPMLWGSYLIAFWALLSLPLLVSNFKTIRRKQILYSLVLSLPIWMLLVISIIQPDNYDKLLERALSFIIFPIGIFLGGLTLQPKEWRWLSRVFVGGLVLLCIKAFIQYLILPNHVVYTPQHDFIFRYRNEFNSNTGIAPTYASMYIVFAIIIIVIDGFRNRRTLFPLIFLMIFLLGNLFLLAAKMPIIALGLIVLLLWFTGYIRGVSLKRKWVLMLGVVLVAGITCLLVFTRWNEIITFMNYSSTQTNENSVGIRRMINQCNIEIASNHFWSGVGPLNAQQELTRCYYQFEGDDFSRHVFNSHNQYFDYLISYGIVGLILLLVISGLPLMVGIKRRDPLLLTFSVLTILCLLTENILSRHSGVIFYCFFYCLLLNKMNEHKKTPEVISEV